MDGDIGVAEQLGKDAEHCLSSFARKMHLYQIKLETLREQKEEAEREERGVARRIAELKEAEMAYKREAASIHEQLAARSRQFQELTILASEHLSVKALRMETARLQTLILGLQMQEKRLLKEGEGRPAVDEAAVSALLAEAQAVQSRYQQAAAEHLKVCAEVRSAMARAFRDRCVRARGRAAEDDYCRQLEEAIEDMTLLHVEMELTEDKDQAVHGVVGADAGAGAPVESALTRLALLRDECDAQFGRLTVALQDRVQRNRQLARELGLLVEDDYRGEAPDEHAVPNSTASTAQGRDAEGADGDGHGPTTATTATGDLGLGHAAAAHAVFPGKADPSRPLAGKVPAAAASAEVAAGVAVPLPLPALPRLARPPQPPVALSLNGSADCVGEIVLDSD